MARRPLLASLPLRSHWVEPAAARMRKRATGCIALMRYSPFFANPDKTASAWQIA